MAKEKKIWKNGEFINWDDANVHVMTHALHYGTSVFEGIRCYKTSRGSEVFHLQKHVARLFNSAKIYRMEIPFTQAEFCEAILETIKANELEHCYIRPVVFRGTGSMGVNPLGNSVESYIAVWEWGKYLGDEAIEQGVDVCTSSWQRSAPNTIPTMAKAGGNYLNSILVKMEALINGYSEGIALDTNGYISEGSGENIFVIQDSVIWTTPVSGAILPGITRGCVMKIAGELGYEVREQFIPREMLYIADEAFLTGTAAELTPLRTVDKIQIGQGRRGPITTALQSAFFDYVEGRTEDRWGWLTAVNPK